MADEAASWAASLHDPAASSKAKLAALAKLADLARHEPSEALRVFDGVAEAFDAALAEKEKASKELSTSLGRMHETTLLILIRATRYRLRTAQLLDFVRGDVALGLSILQQLIGCAAYEDEAIACALELLAGFARPDTYLEIDGFSDKNGEGSVEAFSACLESFSAELLKSKLLLACVPALATRLAKRGGGGGGGGGGGQAQLSAGQLGCARGFLRFICCLSLLNFDDATACAKGLAAASAAGSTLVLPLLQRLAGELDAETQLLLMAAEEEAGGGHGRAARANNEWEDPPPPPPPPSPPSRPPPPPLLVLALKTAVLLCFRAPAQVASAVRASGVLGTLVRLLVYPGGSTRPTALLLALAINVDALAPLGRLGVHCPEAEVRASETFLGELQATLETLEVAEAAELLHCVESGIGSSALSALPVQRDACTCDDLGDLLQQILVCAQPQESAALLEQLQQLEAKAAHLETVQAELRGLADEQLPSMRAAFDQLAMLEDELAEGEAQAAALAGKLGVDLDTALEGDDELERWERELADVAMRTSVSLGRLASAAGALATEDGGGDDDVPRAAALRLPPRSREAGGVSGDKASCTTAASVAASTVATAPVPVPSPAAAADVVGGAGGEGSSTRGARDGGGGGGGGGTIKASERYRLLGELPQLSASKPQKEGAAAPQRRKPARRKPPKPSGGGPQLEANVPHEFLCELNHHVMRKPVKTPEGHVFEAESIEAWLKQHNVCPVSGNPLFFEDLHVHTALKKRIQDYHIQTGLAKQAAQGDDDGTL